MAIAETDTPTLADVIRTGIQAATRSLGVALPGTVVSYDDDSQTATVQPGVHRVVPTIEDESELEAEALPAVQNVPVCWLVGRGIQVKASLEAGDSVLLICLDRDPSGWMRSGRAQPPDDVREHHWANAVAIPGLVPSSSPFDTPGDAAALASKVDIILAALNNGTPGNAFGASVQSYLTNNGLAGPGATTASEVLLLDG